jgi:uncharacterized protein YndB with AHSA1/START domain
MRVTQHPTHEATDPAGPAGRTPERDDTMTQHGRLGDFRYVPNGVAVRYERRLEATTVRTWTALTEPRQLARWLGDATVDDRDVTLRLAPNAATATGRITYCDPAQMLEVDLQWPGEPPARFVAEVAELSATRSIVVVEYRGLPEVVAAERAAEWHARMNVLAAVAAGEPGAEWDPAEPPSGLVAAYEAALQELRRLS